MHSDNIVSLLHGITFIYSTQTASSKFTLHHSKNKFCETSRMRTLHSPPFYPAVSREVSWLPLGVRKNLDMAERSVEEILGDIPRSKESCEQVWAWLQSQKPTLDGGPVSQEIRSGPIPIRADRIC